MGEDPVMNGERKPHDWLEKVLADLQKRGVIIAFLAAATARKVILVYKLKDTSPEFYDPFPFPFRLRWILIAFQILRGNFYFLNVVEREPFNINIQQLSSLT